MTMTSLEVGTPARAFSAQTEADFYAQVQRDLRAFDQIAHIAPMTHSDCEGFISKAEVYVCTKLPYLRERVAGLLATPASREDIAKEVVVLCGSYPNALTRNLSVFTRQVCEDIAARRPTIFELKAATAMTRKNCEFLSIATILNALELCRIDEYPGRFDDFEREVQMARNELDHRSTKSAEADPYQAFRETERARDVEACRKQLRAGRSGQGFSFDALCEARRLEGIDDVDAVGDGSDEASPRDLAARSIQVSNEEILP